MKAFSLVNAPHLPVTGESHPLVRESMRWLTTGNAVALIGAVAIFLGLYAWSQEDPEEPPVVKISGGIIIDKPPVPRPVVEEPRGADEPEPPVTPKEIAVPVPVDREIDDPFPTIEEFRKWRDREGERDGPIEMTPDETGREPAVPYAMAFDDLPELLSIQAPTYPELARQAGLEGTVRVMVFVTRAGKVSQAIAVEGPEVFWNAAVAAAKTALFTPAKQGDNPVDVWVIIPVTFSLNR